MVNVTWFSHGYGHCSCTIHNLQSTSTRISDEYHKAQQQRSNQVLFVPTLVDEGLDHQPSEEPGRAFSNHHMVALTICQTKVVMSFDMQCTSVPPVSAYPSGVCLVYIEVY